MSSWLNVKVNRWEGMGTENHLIGLNKASQSTCYIGIPVFVKFTFWCENIAVGRSVLMLILCSWATCSLLAFSPSLFASCLNVSSPLHSGSRSSKTFKPKKNIPEGSHQYELLKHAEATLGSGNLRMAVMLPEGEDLNEWVAVNTVDFFNQINMLYGTITDFCTEESCPVMSAGPKYEYHWADGTNIKKPIKCSAPKYIDYLMTWVQDQLDDETLFPSKIGVPFPKNFMSVAKTILKRLFRVYAHIYHQHFDPVIQLQEEAHLNTSFKHFIFFVQEFNLIDRRELAPLQELIEKLTSKDR